MESKPYLVIARKYRPQTFDEVVGQEPIATTLKNAIRLNRIGHAYLFTGPRGVGKTSMARIFAKALNCKSGPTVTPCGTCPACAEIEATRSLDVIEIDGASNRGIDEIRALRENVRFSPASGKFKIYIIDEVHQITPEAFNALLKTLEEPPAHVKFIFATTTVQKVPATILSRCQRFDFRRIATAEIVSTLSQICKKEKIKIDDDALFVIAKAGDGSLRDGQSILDQIAASTDGKISATDVTRSLGVLEEEKLLALMDALAARQAPQALRILDGVLKEGKDPALFMEKLLEHVRNLLFLAVSEKLSDLVDATESYRQGLLEQKKRFSRQDLFYFFNVIAHTLQILRRFETKRIPLEIALIKLADRVPMESISELLEQLKASEKKTTVPEIKSETEEEKESEIEELPSEELSIKLPMRQEAQALDSIWEPLLKALKGEKISVASYLAEGRPAGLANGMVKIVFPARLVFHKESLETASNRSLVEKYLTHFLEQPTRVEFECVPDEANPKEELRKGGTAFDAKNSEALDSTVKSAMNIFGGRVIQ